MVAAFARNGIKLEHSERDRSQIYLDALPLFSSGRVKLIDNSKLAAQFFSLERRTFPNGKDRVDHGVGGHDDLANAAAGALVLAMARKQPMAISKQILERASAPSPHSRGRPRLTPLKRRTL